MTLPTFGLSINTQSDDVLPVIGSDMSVVGLVLPSDDADAAVFPLNTPVVFNSNSTAYLSKIGTGDLYTAITAINDQLADYQVAARVVVVRVAQGATVDETISNIIGSQAGGTGIYALLRAGPLLGVIPRLIGSPGYTGFFTRTSATTTVTRTTKFGGNHGNGVMTLAGTPYTSGAQNGEYTVRCTAAASDGGDFEVVDPRGVVVGTASVGVAFNEEIAFTIADGSTDFEVGDGFDVTVTITGGTAQANPLVVAYPAVLDAILAHAVVGGPGTTIQDAIDWRETISSKRIIPVDNYVARAENGVTTYRDMAAAVLGIAVARDYLHQGIPSHSWANEPIQGIIGPKRYDAFSLTDGATDGQVLLAANIGIIARGELGVETAIANSGFIFIGTDTASEDPLWQMYNVTRMRDYVHLGLLKTLRYRLGRSNIDPHSVTAIHNDITSWLTTLQADYHILGFKVGFDKTKNSPEELRLGHLRVYLREEEPPVLKRITIDSYRYRPALETLLDDLITQANTLVA